MNAILTDSIKSGAAHVLFPPDQVFLWLPGFSGNELPYCSYNECRADQPPYDNRRLHLLPEQDQNGAHYIPPYPVSSETHIAWNTNVSRPYPYHPVPLARSLSSQELAELGRNVIHLLEERPEAYADPAQAIRNAHKSYALAALARMGLFPDRPQTLRPYA